MKIKAICLKTYPDEGDMIDYVEGNLRPCDVMIYKKGKTYEVDSEYYDPEYFQPKELKQD